LCSFGAAQATWLVPRRGITVAGQLRNRTGFADTTPAGEYVPGIASVSQRAAVGWAPMSSSMRTTRSGRTSGPIAPALTTISIAIAI
jgi:hypothetical protein